MQITDVTSTPIAAVESATTAKKAAATKATTDTVSLSAEARATAADGLPIFATAGPSGTTDEIADAARKVKLEERAKADNSKADKLESQFLDEQATKLDKVDRLDKQGVREEEKKKVQLERLIKNGASEEQAKKDKTIRAELRGKDEEVQKQVRFEKVSDKFAGTDQLAARLDKLKEQGAVEEQKKKDQSIQSVDRGIREDTKKGETIGDALRRAKVEDGNKAQRLDRLDSKFKDEASRKAIKVQTVAEKGAISPTEAKELTGLIDKNVEEREKQISAKPGLGGTATSMAASIQIAADQKR